MGDEKNTIITKIPEMVQTENENGVEEVSLELAKAFMKSQGTIARKCSKRGELSHLYLSTQNVWMGQETLADEKKQRPFKQILFALSKGLNLLRVYDSGRLLDWKDNQRRNYRDDYRQNDYRPDRRDNYRRDNRDNYRRNYRNDYSPERRDDYRHERRNDYSPVRRDDYRHERRDAYRPGHSDNYREERRDNRRGNPASKPVICFNFQNNGSCHRGDKCRFREHCQKDN